MTLASLAEAIEWARDRWDNQRSAPLRLHTHDTEGIGPFYSRSFASSLDASPASSATMTQTASCYHPLVRAGQSPLDCPECFGLGVKEVRRDLYLYPMTRALTRLRDSLGPERQPHPYHLVILLAGQRWDARRVADDIGIHWDRAEALFLMALRRLHSHYAEGPVSTQRTSWLEKSASQQAAETAA